MEFILILKPQDVVILLKLVALGKESWSYSRMAMALWMSPSEVHAGVKRAIQSKLASSQPAGVKPNVRNLEEFIIYGLPYVFVPELGEITRGMPTSYAGPPLSKFFIASDDLPPVWPDPDGEVRGQTFSPLYKSVPKAAREDGRLYELLTLVDAVRGGRVREREMACREIKGRLEKYNDG